MTLFFSTTLSRWITLRSRPPRVVRLLQCTPLTYRARSSPTWCLGHCLVCSAESNNISNLSLYLYHRIYSLSESLLICLTIILNEIIHKNYSMFYRIFFIANKDISSMCLSQYYVLQCWDYFQNKSMYDWVDRFQCIISRYLFLIFHLS